MNPIRQTRSAAAPSLPVSTACRALPQPLPTAPRVALVCRWRREKDGRLTCVWERAAPARRPRLVFVSKECRSC